jgi:hypothetical protein
MAPRHSSLLFIAALFAYTSPAVQQPSTVQGRSAVQVDIRYCGAKPQKPPLEKLHFRVSLRNATDEPQWVLLPLVLYSRATHARENAGVSHIDLLSDESHKIKLLRLAGTARLLAGLSNEGGGLQAVLLAGGAEVRVPMLIDYWGTPDGGPLPIDGATAHELILRGKPIAQYFRTPLLTTSGAEAEHLFVVESWQTSDQEEAPIVTERSAPFRIVDALANKCNPKAR